MSATAETKFAILSWDVEDLQTLKPEWTDEECVRWFNRNEKYLSERLIETGWNVLETLLTLDPDPNRRPD